MFRKIFGRILVNSRCAFTNAELIAIYHKRSFRTYFANSIAYSPTNAAKDDIQSSFGEESREGQKVSRMHKLSAEDINEKKHTAPNTKFANSEQIIEDVERLSLEIGELQKERDDFKQKFELITEKYKRALADAENMRQRMQRQIEDAKLFGIQSFCKDMIVVADTLRLAIESVKCEQLSDETVKAMYDGLKGTEAQLLQTFQRHGLSQIKPAEGEKFDPNLHEALYEVGNAEKDSGTIALLEKVGYLLHKRCIRPATVGIFKKV